MSKDDFINEWFAIYDEYETPLNVRVNIMLGLSLKAYEDMQLIIDSKSKEIDDLKKEIAFYQKERMTFIELWGGESWAQK